MLLTFEQRSGHLAQAEAAEGFGFLRHRTTQVPPHPAAPGVVFLTTLLLHMGRSGLLYVKFLQRLSHSLHRVLLHLLQHIWDRGLSVAQGYRGAQGGRPQQSPEGGAGDAQTQREPLSLPKPWRI
uniref:Dynein light chain n=1 Tax=Ursus americanus TaxID=9643 RepID=A0A452QBG5_URSAM